MYTTHNYLCKNIPCLVKLLVVYAQAANEMLKYQFAKKSTKYFYMIISNYPINYRISE